MKRFSYILALALVVTLIFSGCAEEAAKGKIEAQEDQLIEKYESYEEDIQGDDFESGYEKGFEEGISAGYARGYEMGYLDCLDDHGMQDEIDKILNGE